MENMFVVFVASVVMALAIMLGAYSVLRAAQKKIKRAFMSGVYLGYTDAIMDVENAGDMTTDELVEQYVKKHGLEEMYERV